MLRTDFIKHHSYTYYRGEFPKESSRRRKRARLLIRRGTIWCLGLDNSGVIRAAGSAFVIQPVEPRKPFSSAVITEYILEQSGRAAV